MHVWTADKHARKFFGHPECAVSNGRGTIDAIRAQAGFLRLLAVNDGVKGRGPGTEGRVPCWVSLQKAEVARPFCRGPGTEGRVPCWVSLQKAEVARPFSASRLCSRERREERTTGPVGEENQNHQLSHRSSRFVGRRPFPGRMGATTKETLHRR